MSEWTEEQEQLLITWAEKASGYAWLHSQSVNIYRHRNLIISIPAALFAYIAGSVTLLGHNEENSWKTGIVGVTGIMAGVLSNFQEIFTYKQLSERHRISSLQFMRFFRDISVELSMHPENRVKPTEYINLKRHQFDKMLEQTPPYPQSILNKFNTKFENAKVHKPDVANKLQTIIPYRQKMACLTFRQLLIARKYFNRWRQKIAIKKRDYVVNVSRQFNNLVEVANSDPFNHDYIRERQFFSTLGSISSNSMENIPIQDSMRPLSGDSV